MNNVKNVLQVVINIEAAETVQDLKSIIQATIGDVDIIKYAVNPKNVILYIESQPSDKLHTIKIEDSGKKYSIINVVESIIELNSKVYSGTVSEVFSEKELDEPLAAMAILFDTDPQIDYLLTKEFKISNLSSYDGLLSISTDNGLVLIEKQCNVVIDYSTYNPETGTVRLAQTSRSEESKELSERAEKSSQVQLAIQNEQNIVNMREALNMVKDLSDLSEEEIMAEVTKAFEDLESLFEDIENHPSENVFLSDPHKLSADDYLTEIKSLMEIYEISNQNLAEFVFDFGLQFEYLELKKIISDEDTILNVLMDKIRERNPVESRKEPVANDSSSHEGDDTDFIKSETLSEQAFTQMISLLSDFDSNADVQTQENTHSIHEELSTEELESITKGYRTIINIEANVETISFDKFDDMAEKYHIVGWDLSTPNTLSITFIEGTTPESTVKKFHDMMNGLDSRLINTAHFNNLKELEESTKFLAELRNIISDDTDIAQEFINRVKKHNIFVRETMAKMRSALLDMENDFERVLKDEVNLSIDWETLTAFAAKKERTEIRTSGVKKGVKLDVENNNGYSLVKVITNEKNGDFYIPLSLVTDDIRSTYELDDYYYYIEFVPNYAFYEVLVNGHVMLIEKTDL